MKRVLANTKGGAAFWLHPDGTPYDQELQIGDVVKDIDYGTVKDQRSGMNEKEKHLVEIAAEGMRGFADDDTTEDPAFGSSATQLGANQKKIKGISMDDQELYFGE